MGRIVKQAYIPATGGTGPWVEGDPAVWAFDAYVPHPCAQWIPALSDTSAAAAAVAAEALGALDADPRGGGIAWVLSRIESAASSIIEHVNPHPRRMLIAEAVRAPADAPSRDDLETLRNVAATHHALTLGDDSAAVSVADICKVHTILMGDDPIAGRLRTVQNWIGGRFSSPVDAVFVPPPADEVPALMDDLVACINRRGVDPVIQAAIVHAQFETIHPFVDGNGRAGRALIHLVLRRGGVCTDTVLPISATLAALHRGYIDGLTNYRAQCEPLAEVRSAAASRWVDYFSEAVTRAVTAAHNAADRIDTLQQQWRQSLPRRTPATERLIGALPANPILNTKTAAQLAGCDERTALRCLDLLETAKVVEQVTAGRRNRVYAATGIIELVALRLRTLL